MPSAIAVGAKLLADDATLAAFINSITPTPSPACAFSATAALFTCAFNTSTLPNEPFAASEVSESTAAILSATALIASVVLDFSAVQAAPPQPPPDVDA